MASWKRWMLARLRCKWSFDVARCKYWCNFNASANANVECCRGFMEKMNVGIASIRMKHWRSFMASVRMKCRRSFMTKMNAGMALMQIECCCGFMEKMDVGTASVWMKCRCGLNTNRMSRQLYGKRKVLVQLHYKGKWWCDFIADANTNITLWQRWMLAWLQYKDKG